jgi:hypothetical protein
LYCRRSRFRTAAVAADINKIQYYYDASETKTKERKNFTFLLLCSAPFPQCAAAAHGPETNGSGILVKQ